MNKQVKQAIIKGALDIIATIVAFVIMYKFMVFLWDSAPFGTDAEGAIAFILAIPPIIIILEVWKRYGTNPLEKEEPKPAIIQMPELDTLSEYQIHLLASVLHIINTMAITKKNAVNVSRDVIREIVGSHQMTSRNALGELSKVVDRKELRYGTREFSKFVVVLHKISPNTARKLHMTEISHGCEVKLQSLLVLLGYNEEDTRTVMKEIISRFRLHGINKRTLDALFDKTTQIQISVRQVYNNVGNNFAYAPTDFAAIEKLQAEAVETFKVFLNTDVSVKVAGPRIAHPVGKCEGCEKECEGTEVLCEECKTLFLNIQKGIDDNTLPMQFLGDGES